MAGVIGPQHQADKKVGSNGWGDGHQHDLVVYQVKHACSNRGDVRGGVCVRNFFCREESFGLFLTCFEFSACLWVPVLVHKLEWSL